MGREKIRSAMTRGEYESYKPLLGDELLRAMLVSVSCCFSGHRTEKLRAAGIALSDKELEQKLRAAVTSAIGDGYWRFIAGGSRGADAMAAKIVLEERNKNPDVFLEIAAPCINQSELWPLSDRLAYAETLESADDVRQVTGKPYAPDCMQKRNIYMIDSSSLLVCVYAGASGGTKNAVEYARKSGIAIKNVLDFQVK